MRRNNRFKLIIAICMLGIAFAFIVGIFYLIISSHSSYDFPTSVIAHEIEMSDDDVNTQITFNHTEIELDVITEYQRYFMDINVTNYTLSLEQMDWERSSYNDDTRTISIGIMGLENRSDYYRLVFTHEFFHYTLYRMHLTNHNMHEALTDVYTRTTNEDTQKELWGDSNQKRTYPYTILTKDIIARNAECVKTVFDENNKMQTVLELLDRIETKCDINILNIINQL